MCASKGERGLWGVILMSLLSTAPGVHAQGCEPWVAKIISVQGPVEVEVERSGAHAQAVGQDDPVCPGDRVRVGALGRAAVQLADEAETLIRLDEGTTLIFPVPKPEKSLLLKLIEGVLHVLRVCEKTYCARDLAFRRSAGTGVYIEIHEDSEHRRNARSRAQ